MIYFIRHGQSQANADNVFGSPETPLTEIGRQQAKAAGEKLKADGIVVDRIISSTYGRAVDTAKIIADEIGFGIDKIQYDHRLVEFNVGDLVGKTESGVSTQQAVSANGAEDAHSFQHRVVAAMSDAKALPGNTLVVSHAGVGRMITAIKLGIDPRDHHSIEPFANAQIVALD